MMMNILDHNLIVKPYKQRVLNPFKPVCVYRNLNCPQGQNKKYSIKQNGLVIGHTNELILWNVEFKVSKSGRARVIKEERKNVHAYAKGMISQTTHEEDIIFDKKIIYNPYLSENFLCEGEVINKASFLKFTDSGVYLGEKML